MKTIILTLLFFTITTFSFTQTISTKVIGEIPLGSYSYYILEESNAYLKSTLASPRLFGYGEELILEPSSNSGYYRIVNYSDPNLLFQYYDDSQGAIIPKEIMWRLPQYDQEILFFDNEYHLHDFCDLLNDYLESYNDSIQDVQMEILMDNFQGFFSFENLLNSKYDVRNSEFTDQEIEAMAKEDFVNDYVLKHLLSSNRFMGIGDSVYFWYNRDLIISIDASKFSIYKSDLVAASNSQIDPWDATSAIFRSGDIVYQSPTSGKKVKNRAFLILDNFNGNLRYQTIITTTAIVEPCNKFKKALKVELFEDNTNNVNGNITGSYHVYPSNFILVIDWNDGTPLQTINNYDGLSNIEHTYASEGIFHPITKAIFVDLNGNEQNIFDGTNAPINVGANGIPSAPTPFEFNTSMACTDEDRELFGTQTSGNWKLEAKIWVNHNIFGHHIGSYTHAWKYQNGKWKRKRAHIYCNIHGTFRNDNCEVTETKSGSDTENNQERVRVTVNKMFKKYRAAGNDSIFSEHNLSKDGTYLELYLTLTPCP